MPGLDSTLREKIIAQPDVILEDSALMEALIAANAQALGANVVDLRGIAMARLEERLDRLEDTHKTVIATAYDNLAGTNQIHRAVLRLLDANDFDDFLADLGGEVSDILGVDRLRLVLETAQEQDDPVLDRFGGLLAIVDPGSVTHYMEGGRTGTPRTVILRQTDGYAPGFFYGDMAPQIASEACLRLDFGPGRLPGMLLLGSETAEQFTAQHATDLLAFFAGVFERTMRRWLA
ncbi:DUF484 family protein [Pseudooceanicola sp. CBS1P-1]|uniref:DUF484 family protein n=1 Tax=Pseudooceanicola albus TaxID=2692189 RepID=A0A6L7FYS6_9RHOB|nr:MULTISPECIES: DUF484 family protein [Pseudooceanicola]MBT9382716.1 DUF484 family protein [Pseudooceanicola endophyticus]MXN17254.1 DUF484 family protein [Pseudooceanicola albus]